MITLLIYVFYGGKIKMKGFKFFVLTLLSLVLFTAGAVSTVFAADFVQLDKVEINGQVVSNFALDANGVLVPSNLAPIYLERQEQAYVVVYFTGLPPCTSNNSNTCYNVRVSAEIEGYEYGDVRDVTPVFEVEPNVQYRKVLKITLPEDISASDDKQIYIEIRDDNNEISAKVPIRVQEIRHKLNVYDAIFNPTNNAQAGQPLFTSIRIENLGDNVETSIKATVSIPALGIQTSEYVDSLATVQGDTHISHTYSDETNDAATTNDLLLMIPQNAQEGDYNIVLTLEYNRGRSTEQKTYKMHIKAAPVAGNTQGGSQGAAEKQFPATTINIDSLVQRVEEGNGASFKLSVSNLGQQAVSYTFDLVGVSDWANIKTDPSTLVVQQNSASDAYIYVAPKAGVTGIKMFTLRVMSGNTLVAEKSLSVEVLQKQKGVDFKTAFTWIFAVLLVILAILVIVVLVKKFASKGDKGIEGQTYY